jgi:hypothetical protein
VSQQAAEFAVRVFLFRIPAYIPEASHAESSILSILFVKVDPANVLLSPLDGESCIDNDGVQPGSKARLPAEPADVSDGAQHRFLNQIVGFICICGITARNAVQHLLVATEQRTQSAGISVLGCDDEFFIATLPVANFDVLEQNSRTHFVRKLRLRLACQLHCILRMRPESALL